MKVRGLGNLISTPSIAQLTRSFEDSEKTGQSYTVMRAWSCTRVPATTARLRFGLSR